MSCALASVESTFEFLLSKGKGACFSYALLELTYNWPFFSVGWDLFGSEKTSGQWVLGEHWIRATLSSVRYFSVTPVQRPSENLELSGADGS